MKRQLFLVAACASALLVIGACSSFSESDTPPNPSEGGVVDAPAPLDGQSDSDGGNPPPSDDTCPGCVVVGSSDSAPVIDVRLDEANVLWTSITDPWSVDASGHLDWAHQDGSGAGAGPTFAPPSALGSLTGDGTATGAWLSTFNSSGADTASIAAITDKSGLLSYANLPFGVGDRTVRLTVDQRNLYWLSLGGLGGGPSVLYQLPLGSVDAGKDDSNTLDNTVPATVTDLAVVSLNAGAVVFLLDGGNVDSLVVGSQVRTPYLVGLGATSLASDANALYVAAGSAVYACTFTGPTGSLTACETSAPAIQVENEVFVNVIAQGGTLFAATKSGSIWAWVTSGGGGPAKRLVSNRPLFDGDEYTKGHPLAANSQYVFFSEAAGAGAHHIVRVPH